MDALIIFGANYLIILVVGALGLVWWIVDRPRKVELVVLAVVAGGIALILSRIAGHLYFDSRPFVVEHVQPLIGHSADNGFPSDHALLTMTLTAVVFFYNKKVAVAMAVMTVLIGVARVAALVHSPLDIAAGWVIGILGAVAAYYLVGWAMKRFLRPASTVKHERSA